MVLPQRLPMRTLQNLELASSRLSEGNKCRQP